MQGSWNNGKPYYRCKFPAEYAVTKQQHAKTIYVREDAIVPALDVWIGSLSDDDHLDATAQTPAAASGAIPDESPGLELRRRLEECDTKLAKYRALLEHDADIIIAVTWIAETERERRSLKRELGRKPTPRKLTETEIKALVTQLRDIVAVPADADPADKRAIYEELGVNLTHHSDGRAHVAAGARHVLGVRVGGTSTRDNHPAWRLREWGGRATSMNVKRTQLAAGPAR
ncbi:MAG: hypothetical protein GXP34_08020 [Actinobacteria bacterium]|nr:hypothetical protein [Actinomycetota bacterium]